MKTHAALAIAVIAVFAGTPARAQQALETAEQTAPVAADDVKDAGATGRAKRPDKEALLRAQAAGYKLTTKDGKEVFCKKEMVTGSRLATRTRCLTLAQIEAERNATKDMLMDMSRKTINVPQE
jgi:hypothetical protein